MKDEELFAEDIFGFHMQQAVEKSLKAWLSIIGDEYPRTHDINLLLRRLERIGQDVSLFQDFVELNMYAVQFRYDNFDAGGDSFDRDDACEQAMRLYENVVNIMNENMQM